MQAWMLPHLAKKMFYKQSIGAVQKEVLQDGTGYWTQLMELEGACVHPYLHLNVDLLMGYSFCEILIRVYDAPHIIKHL